MMIHAGQRQIITDNNQQQKKYDEPSSAVLASDDGELLFLYWSKWPEMVNDRSTIRPQSSLTNDKSGTTASNNGQITRNRWFTKHETHHKTKVMSG